MIGRRRYDVTRTLNPHKWERERERETHRARQRAACAILAHPGVTVGSAGRWFANYLNLPKPQPRRPRKPQLPSSWPPLAASHPPFLLSAIPLFLSPQPPSDYPFPLRLPIYVYLPFFSRSRLLLLSSRNRRVLHSRRFREFSEYFWSCNLRPRASYRD